MNSLQIRATKACVPYAALLIVAVVTYLLEPTHVQKALIGTVQTGLTHYAFLRTIYSWSTWHWELFWTVSTPYKAVQGGEWWGSIIVVGPVLILLWSYLALRGQRVPGARSAHVERVDDRSPI